MKWVETPEDPEEFSGKDILKALGEEEKHDEKDFAHDPEMTRLKEAMAARLKANADDPTNGIAYMTIDTAPKPIIKLMTAINGGKLPGLPARGFIVLVDMPLPLVAEISKTARNMVNDTALHARLGIKIDKTAEEEHGDELV